MLENNAFVRFEGIATSSIDFSYRGLSDAIMFSFDWKNVEVWQFSSSAMCGFLFVNSFSWNGTDVDEIREAMAVSEVLTAESMIRFCELCCCATVPGFLDPGGKWTNVFAQFLQVVVNFLRNPNYNSQVWPHVRTVIDQWGLDWLVNCRLMNVFHRESYYRKAREVDISRTHNVAEYDFALRLFGGKCPEASVEALVDVYSYFADRFAIVDFNAFTDRLMFDPRMMAFGELESKAFCTWYNENR